MTRVALGLLMSAACALPARADVVITEVGFDPGWIELHNLSASPVDLRGCSLVGDVQHRFERATELPGGAFALLVEPDRPALSPGGAVWIRPWGRGRTRRRGRLSLHDAAGRRIEHVAYEAAPAAPGGPTLQRLAPGSDGPASWTWASPTPGGPPPGAQLLRLLLDAPVIEQGRPSSGSPVHVSVRLLDGDRETPVVVRWSSRHGEGQASLEPAEPGPGGVRFAGAVPGLPDQTLVSLSFVAHDDSGPVTLERDDDGAPLRYFVFDGVATDLPLYCLEVRPDRLDDLQDEPERERFPLVLVRVEAGRATVHAGGTLQARGGTWTRRWLKKNWVVSLARGQDLDGRRQLNLRSEWHDSTALRELLALELYAIAGVPAPRARHVRVHLNGEYYGLFLDVDMVDGDLLARNGLGGGVLYQAKVAKDQSGPDRCDARSYPSLVGYEAHWSKRTHHDESHADLAAFIDGFHAAPTPEALEAYFAERLEVERYVDYLAVNAYISHWDSLVKNYYWCLDREGTGRWIVLPWDLDRTWGDHVEGPGYASAPVTQGTFEDRIGGERNWWNWLEDRFLSVPANRRRLHERVLELVSEVPAARIERVIVERARALRGEILLDRARWGAYAHGEEPDSYVAGPFAPGDLDGAVAQLTEYVKNRLRSLQRGCRLELHRSGHRFTPAVAAAPAAKAPGAASRSDAWVLLLPVLAFFYLASGHGVEERL